MKRARVPLQHQHNTPGIRGRCRTSECHGTGGNPQLQLMGHLCHTEGLVDVRRPHGLTQCEDAHLVRASMMRPGPISIM